MVSLRDDTSRLHFIWHLGLGWVGLGGRDLHVDYHSRLFGGRRLLGGVDHDGLHKNV